MSLAESQTAEIVTIRRKVSTTRYGKSILAAMMVGFLLRVGVAIWNGFFGPSFGAEADASTFHNKAVDFGAGLSPFTFGIGDIFYYYLGSIYYLTTDSLFIGSLLSCLVWLSSAVILVKIMRVLFFSNTNQFRVMLIYALLPSAILFTSVTLREPYQLLFVNLAILSVLKIILHKSFKHWLLLLFAVVGAGVLHATLFAFGVFIISAALFLIILPENKKIPIFKIMIIVPIAVVVLFLGTLSLTNITQYQLDQGLTKAIEIYQMGGLLYLDEARAFYKTSVEIDGITGLVTFIPVSLFQYLFEPMPWRISTIADIVLFLENFLRAWLIWKAWVGLRNIPANHSSPILFIFFSYLVIETIWSLGTINWGTAVRHHIPGMGMLLLAGFAYAKLQSTKKRRHQFSWLKKNNKIH